MTLEFSRSSSRRRSLMLGGAVLALSSAFAAQAFAHTDPMPGVDAIASQLVVTDQQAVDRPVHASASDAAISVQVQPDNTAISLTDNAVRSAARANTASATLSPQANDLGTGIGTSLSTGIDGSTGQSSALIATRQAIANGSAVTADTTDALIHAQLGHLSASSATIADNSQEALALGNEARASLGLTGVSAAAGAGILNDQSIGRDAGGVTAKFSGAARIEVTDAPDSRLELADNLQRAIGYGNSGDNSLSIDAVQIAARGEGGITAGRLSAPGAQVDATYALLSDQRLSSGVTGKAEGGFDVAIGNTAFAASIANEANRLVAAGYGNQSANALALRANSIATDDLGDGKVANITNGQHVTFAPVMATTDGGASVSVAKDAVEASLSADSNSVMAVAKANQADGNLLSVSANSIGVSEGGSDQSARLIGGSEYGSEAFSVHNAQASNGFVLAKALNSGTLIDVGKGIIRSSASADGNSASSEATGNDASNGLTLDATRLATGGLVENLQQGKGLVSARVGAEDNPAGAAITAQGDIVDSRLSVAGNQLSGAAAQNEVVNRLAVSANSIGGGTGADSEGGVEGDAAAFALTNTQSAGGGHGQASVKSSVTGKFEIAGASVTRSALSVADNSQTASALGNGATNALALTTTELGEGSQASLSSVQMGFGAIEAASDMTLGLTAHSVDSALDLTNNRNSAAAVMNDVANSMAVTTLSAAFSDPQALSSKQIAYGNVEATATTHGLSAEPTAAISRSSHEASGNTTVAQANANNALNSLQVEGATQAMLSNDQRSRADVTADASSAFGAKGATTSDARIEVLGNATTAQARGNMAVNALSLSLPTGQSGSTEMAAITTAPLNSASGPAVLVNYQTNGGAVSALATSPAVSLTYGDASASSLRVTDNSVAASAYGNSANNSIGIAATGVLPAAAISNVQMNSGSVTAYADSAAFTQAPVHLWASAASITGNSISASAVGNAASSAITAAR